MRDERSLSRTEAACMAGAGRGWNGIDELRALSANDTERWYTVEQFERDHVVEILEKLEEGSLDDEIWGKIILMEKCRRLAKAYLRRTTVIIDGSSDEYDGITLGFNHFENYDNDDIRHKIGDGVIVKVDENGNIKAMARGLAPVIVQGWNEPTSKCISEQLITQKGRLKTIKDRLKGITDQQRIEKIFDMRLFNLAIERELNEPEPNTPELLLKTCIRVSLVKDAATNALKTPCWFMIINLVALDVLRTKLPVLRDNRPVSGTFRPSSRNDIIFSTPATTQSTATLNEIFPSCTKQLMYSSGRRSESLSVLDQVRQLIEFASTLQTSQNSIPIRQQRSLSCSDSEEIPTPMQKAIHNKKKRSPSKNLSLSSKSSSGFSSMDFVKNFEKVENWRKNSSGFLEQKKDEILADEETDDTTSSEHELIKPTEQWSVGKSPPFTQRKLLLSNDQSVNKNSDNNKATNFSNSYICQGGHCIRISDYDEHVQDELKQKSADNKSRTQHCCSISTEENMDPMEVAQYPCKTEPQGSQLLNQKCRIEESKIVVKNTSHTNSCLTMKDNIYSDKDPKYLGKLTAKQKVATRKNSKLVTDDVNHCLMYPKNDSSRLQVNYPDSSYNAKRYANKQHIDMTRIPATSDKDQSDLFSELPEVDHPVETIYRSDHENMKKRADISDMGYPKHHYSRTAEDRHKVSCCTSRHPCLSETSNAKKNHLKNLFIPSKKLLRNMGSNFNSQQNFGKFPDMQQSSRYLKIHRCRPEEVRSGARCQLSQVEPVVHRILIMSKKEKEAMTLPQKKVTTRKSGLAESIHTSHFFVNPVCANGVTGSNRIKQPEIMIPRCETPSSHNISRDNRKNMNVSIPYERDTLIASHPSYSLSSNKPRKAFRRFIW